LGHQASSFQKGKDLQLKIQKQYNFLKIKDLQLHNLSCGCQATIFKKENDRIVFKISKGI